MIPVSILYLVALLEWFSTLAVEVLAIRLATPIVGSSIILTSVFLGVVLLALSSGYRIGWTLAASMKPKHIVLYTAVSLWFSSARYLFLTFPNQTRLLEYMLSITDNYILTLFIVAFLLFFLPVLIASQTIPLLTELLPSTSKGKAAGSMLFASTIGSFLGSVLPSVVLFETIGVQYTGIIVWAVGLIACGCILRFVSKKAAAVLRFAAIVWACGVAWYHSSAHDAGVIYSFDSAYQEIVVREGSIAERPVRIFLTNGAFSSGISTETKTSPFEYIKEAITVTNVLQPKRILVIGTAGFTYPHEVAALPFVEQIDAVDIDPRVKTIAETYFLQEPLADSITFIPQSARFFVNQAIQEQIQYDLIFVDAYNGKSVPDELTTKEFFAGLQTLAPNGIVLFNIIHDASATSTYAKNMYTTLDSVFGAMYSKNVSQNSTITMDNFIATPYAFDSTYLRRPANGHLYTDNKRTTEIDSVAMRQKHSIPSQ